MLFLKILLVILGILLLVFFMGSLFLFLYAIVGDSKELDYSIRERHFKKQGKEKYLPKFKEGQNWFSLHKEELEPCYVESVDGLKLYGELYQVPDAKGVLLLFHGYRSYAHLDFAPITPFYASLGYHILFVSERARKPSEGKYMSYGILERYDVKHWARFITKKFPDLPIVLSGISMGASTVLMAAELKGIPKNVMGVIADCGYADPKEEMFHVLRDCYHLPTFPFYRTVDFLCRVFCHFSLEGHSIIESIHEISVPVLFIHGGNDHFVLTEYSEKMYKELKGEKELLIVEGAAHTAAYLEDPKRVETTVKSFLQKCESLHQKNKKE